jgi:hypothetical protein
MVRMLRHTDVFTWENPPTRDPDTGSLTMAAWITSIKNAKSVITSSAFVFHLVQNAIRLSTSDAHPFFYQTGYPLDTKKSPVSELVK